MKSRLVACTEIIDEVDTDRVLMLMVSTWPWIGSDQNSSSVSEGIPSYCDEGASSDADSAIQAINYQKKEAIFGGK